MNGYWRIPPRLRKYFDRELELFAIEVESGNLEAAWHRLERAHIIGQPAAVEHTRVHWLMLKFGMRIKRTREIIGQIPRLLVGGVKSFVGKIPVGNTGGANVSPFQPMKIPADIREMMEPFNKA